MVASPGRPGAEPAPLSCPACGTPTVPDARYCFHCGVPLEATGPGGHDEGAERRVVTVLFGDLSDFTAWAEDLDPERVGEVIDRVLAALARAVADVGGRVDKLTGDGIMAVFGAPTAQEDDPERAVRAAVAMQDEVRRLVAVEAGGGRRLGLRVGLNTGEVLAGVQASFAYTVVGDAVNTAARLSDAARVGGVYAGRDTALATRSIATWRALPPLRLKGKRAPVPAYELVNLRPSDTARLGLGDEAPLIGRDAELGVLLGRFLDVVSRSAPGTLLVGGEAGIGKTRLAQELARFVGEVPGARVLWGRATPYGDGRDLSLLVEVVRTACGVDDDDRQAAVARVGRTVSRLEPPSSPAWLPGALVERLLTLLGLAPDGRSVAPRDLPSPDPVSRDGVLDGVGTLLTAIAARGPLLVCLDDLHWATDELYEALRAVARHLAGPVLLLLLARDEVDVRGLPDTERLRLDPLEEPAAARLLRTYLGGTELPPSARAALLGRARGNPYFLAELLHLLVDRGVLRRGHSAEEPAWVLCGELPEDALPAAVQAVLAARIDRLEQTGKAVLRTAAVLGSRFPAEALPAIEPWPPAAVAEAMDELSARQLVRAPEHGEHLWSFVHPMARDVAYAGLPKAERARRHALAARWAVEAMTGPPAEVDGFVAGHAEHATELAASMALPAGDVAWSARGVGVPALVRLAESALARDEHRAAAGLLARARALGAGVLPDSELLPVRVLHAEALASQRQLTEAEEALRPALTVTTPGLRAAAYCVLGDIRHKQGRVDASAQALVTALAEAADAGDERIVGAALRQLGLLEFHAGRLRAAEERFSDALRLARQVGDPRGAGWALQHMAWSATTRGDYAAAESTLREAAEVFRALKDTGGLGWCAGTEALVRVLQGRLSDAREISRGLVPVAEALGDRWGLATCLTIDALAAAELGDVEAAEREAASAVDTFTAAGDTWGRALALVARGLAARGAGDPERGLVHLREAVAATNAGPHALVGALALVSLGLTALDANRLDEAQRAADRAMAALERLDLEPHAILGARVLCAQLARARGRLDEAVAMLEEALAAGEPASLMFPRRQAYAHLAGTLLDAGRPARALETARAAVELPSEEVRAQVMALRVLGRALAERRDLAGARAAYEKALAVATSTAATSEAPATRRLLAALPGRPAGR
ncbi:MAG TPA: adenylate/guanylate cyclase domain-containing protein [Frankiaceae bacterium]|nr:adenylate/guanylate cyclase domain-containing protein [Frankiaceae bacterium]